MTQANVKVGVPNVVIAQVRGLGPLVVLLAGLVTLLTCIYFFVDFLARSPALWICLAAFLPVIFWASTFPPHFVIVRNNTIQIAQLMPFIVQTKQFPLEHTAMATGRIVGSWTLLTISCSRPRASYSLWWPIARLNEIRGFIKDQSGA